MYMFDRAAWERDRSTFAASYKHICPLVRRLACDEMLSHVFVTADRSVQETTWRSGTRIFVNFGDAPYKLRNGDELAPLSSRVYAPAAATPAVRRRRS
jgi:hypothetical protein